MMITRAHSRLLREMLETFPVVAVVGSRQVGKSTLVQGSDLSEFRRYYSLDDFPVLDLALKDPSALVTSAPTVTIDEVQRAPDLIMAIKREVDRIRVIGRFLLTGSSDLNFSADLSRILAGRVGVLQLPPITWREQEGRLEPPWFVSWIAGMSCPERGTKGARGELGAFDVKRIFNGGYPLAATADSERKRDLWFESFRTTYLERDVRQVSEIGHLSDFARLLGMAASRTAQALNQASLARDVGLSTATAGRYLSLLEATFQIERMAPHFSNIGKRLVKSPKLFWRDTGMAAYLMGIRTWEQAVAENRAGFLFETFVMMEVEALLNVYSPRSRLFYIRTHGGLEVDGLIENGRRLFPFEIKASRTVRAEDARPLTRYISLERRAESGIVLYLGDEVFPLAAGITAVPVSVFFA